MDVELFASVKRAVDPSQATFKVSGSEVSEPNGANRVKFRKLFIDGSTTNDQIFKESCEPLVDLLISGYNVSTIVSGTARSSRSSVLSGGSRQPGSGGIVVKVIERLFGRLEEDGSLTGTQSSAGANKESSIHVTMVEVRGSRATDVISSRANLVIEEEAEHGDWFRLAEQKRIYSVAEGRQLFTDRFSKKDNSSVNHALLVYIDLIVHFESTGEPHKSRYSFILLPPTDGLIHSSELSEDIKSVAKLGTDLSTQLHPDRVINYRDTVLTKLLQNELGGNCTTKVIICFDPSAELGAQRELLSLSKTLAKVKNFPIMNDIFAQQLVTQYRANIIHYRSLPSTRRPTPVVPPAPIVRTPAPAIFPPQPSHYSGDQLQYENARLMDQVERLQLKLEQLNSKFNTMANSKAELSAQLVECEEEKLKATKSFIDMQIENNKLREEVEASQYELNNKILTLEHDLQISDSDREALSRDLAHLRRQLGHLEHERRGLADEYIGLKASYMNLTDDIDVEVAKNNELTMELLNLLNSRSALALQPDGAKHREEAAALRREEERIREVVHRLSQGKVNTESLRSDRKQKNLLEKEQIFGDETRHKDEMTRLSEEHSEGRRQLQSKIDTLEKEVASLKSLARERQQKISFMNARLLTVGGENSELTTMNNRLQHKVKDMNTEYKLRLTKYVEDISSHLDSSNAEGSQESLAQYVNKMIKDVKAAHKTREEQLSQAAHSYRSRAEGVARTHEQLLCAYRDLRAQVEALGLSDLDLGPDERELIISDTNLQSAQQKEILRLQAELHRVKVNQKQSDGQATPRSSSAQPLRPGTGTFADLDSWTSVRRQLRNFSEQTLRELEEERANLLSKNVILEEQLKESQDYIDQHLARYKEEISKLREQLMYQSRG